MIRLRAAAAYLLASCFVATAAFVAIYFLWYPGVLFAKAGGRDLFLLIVGVDVAIGPLLVFIIFVPGKKGLTFDLVTIACLQAAALGYGSYVLFESRPAFIVFVKDRFELVRANDIPAEELGNASPAFARLPLTGPRIVGARLPTDPKEQFSMMMSALSGLDVQHKPKYYVDYADVRPAVLARAAPIARLRELNPGSPKAIDRMVASLGRPEGELRFLPLRIERRGDLTVIVDSTRAEVLEIVDLRPWEYR